MSYIKSSRGVAGVPEEVSYIKSSRGVAGVPGKVSYIKSSRRIAGVPVSLYHHMGHFVSCIICS